VSAVVQPAGRPADYVDEGPLLDVRDLAVTFRGANGESVEAVSEVSFAVRPGQHVALVGESGSGKSVTSLAVMGLLSKRSTTVTGSIRYAGTELLGLPDNERRDLRGAEMAMIFQDPMTSLNPVISVGVQIAEVLQRHKSLSKGDARDVSGDLLGRVGIADPARRLKEYPHQMSGGMRQRVLIAIALACEPRLLIADEPTTALDVTIQAQILELLRELVSGTGTALVMITHDLGVVAGLCDEVHVMYSGRVVESAPRRPLFATPRHPYTGGLLASIPRLDSPRGRPLSPIPGSPNDAIPWDGACAFAPRCGNEVDICRQKTPQLEPVDGALDTGLRCFNPLGPQESAR
jgi:peptide/nickel transport system ATP-binding protein